MTRQNSVVLVDQNRIGESRLHCPHQALDLRLGVLARVVGIRPEIRERDARPRGPTSRGVSLKRSTRFPPGPY